jgi:hypothetical protein
VLGAPMIGPGPGGGQWDMHETEGVVEQQISPLTVKVWPAAGWGPASTGGVRWALDVSISPDGWGGR